MAPQAPTPRLAGEVALVTGGGSGLGRALVRRFLTEGAHVGVLELSEEKAAALRADHGDEITVTTGDATSWEDNCRAVERTVATFGHLDTFIGNAGIWDFSTALIDLPGDRMEAAFRQLFDLNVLGYLLGARAAVEALRTTAGNIILTASNAAFYPGGGGPLYTSSKHAVVGLVKQLAYELAPDIRVNGVAPGGMATDLRGPAALGLQDTSFGTMPVGQLMAALLPMERPIEPADYTGTYVLLASRQDALTTTGSVHNCDGGFGVRGRKSDATAMAKLLGDPQP